MWSVHLLGVLLVFSFLNFTNGQISHWQRFGNTRNNFNHMRRTNWSPQPTFRRDNQISQRFNPYASSNRIQSRGARQNFLPPSAMRKLLQFVNLHRSSVDAENMYVMKWSNDLARKAGMRSATCQYIHLNSNSGESLIMIPADVRGDNIADYIDKHWIAEKNDFRLGTDCRITSTCSYSQMIWASSRMMGCASHWCAGQQFVVCLFEQKGNIYRRLPYRKGNHCAQCPNYCQQQLCLW